MSLSLSPSPPDEPAPPTGRRRPRRLWPLWRAVLRVGGWLVFGAWSLVLLAWLTLHWGILPRLDEWRPHFEAQASKAAGLPVHIGRIEAYSSAWVPALRLHDVVLRDARGRDALHLAQVSAALSVPALLAGRLRLEQLLIDAPRVEVRRDGQGHLRVAGLDMLGDAAGADGGLADWLFQQHELVLRGGTVRWVDEMRAAPPLELGDVQLVLRNARNRHDLRLDATPPPGWGQRFSVVARARQPLLARDGDWQRWSGTLYADFPQVLVQQLRHHVDLPFELTQGEGALRAWIDFAQGLPQGGSADVALRNVTLRLGPQLAPLALAQVGGRLSLERDADHARLKASHFGFQTLQGQTWPAGDLELGWQQQQVLSLAALNAAAGVPPVTGGEFRADRMDLALMADLAERLPLGANLRRLLAELDPQGQVSRLVASWQGPIDAPARYQVQGEVRGMAMAAARSPEPGGVGRPGWRGADLSFSAHQGGGQASLTLNGGALELPGVFEQPVVELRRFSSQLQWHIEPVAGKLPRITLKLVGTRFENDDARGELEAQWHTGGRPGFGKDARLPGMLEMTGKLSQGKATQVSRYLPLRLPGPVRDYVRLAVQAGQVTGASFRVKGDLWEFPFAKGGDGEFKVVSQVRDVTLAPVPALVSSRAASGPEAAPPTAWPAFSQVSGELVFERLSMQIHRASGQLWGLALDKVDGGIAHLEDQPTLQLEGVVRGPAADLLRYVNLTPIGGWLGGALARSSMDGAAEMNLSLTLPLHQLARSQLKGHVRLAGGDLRLRPDLPLLAAARGKVDFTHKGFSVAGTARAYGGEASIDGGTQPDGSLRFNAQGVATAEGLRRATDLGPVAQWARQAQGAAPYRLQLNLARGYPEMLITSPLTGMAFNLPAPLQKSAETTLPLRVQWSLAPDARADGRTDSKPLQDMLRVDLGALLSAHYLRERNADEPRVLRGALSVGGAALPELAADVPVRLALQRLDADAWWTLAKDPASGLGGGTLMAAAQAATGAAPTSRDTAAGHLPRRVVLSADALTLGGRKLSGVQLELTRRPAPDAGWHARVDADQLRGDIDYTEPRGDNDAGRIRARLARLSLPHSEAARVEGLLERAPEQVPALDLVVDEFELRGRKLGRLSIEAVNRSRDGQASAREWRLNRLALATPEGDLLASGQWGAPRSAGGTAAVSGAAGSDAAGAAGAARRRMGLDFQWQLRDAGALLQRLGFGAVIRGGKGLLQGTVGWDGSPLDLDWPSLGGAMNLALDAGQFLKADPGAGRLLGVLSLQALPRRLALDFRDVFQEGFAFDNITGDLRLDQGMAYTNNLRMRGVQAAVLMEGQADVVHETQDLRVVVVPEINAGTASLAYAVINPALGLGTFLGQWLLRGPLAEAGTREFHVTGGWADPQVAPVSRRALDGGEVAAAGAQSAGAAGTLPAAAAAPAAPQGSRPAATGGDRPLLAPGAAAAAEPIQTPASAPGQAKERPE